MLCVIATAINSVVPMSDTPIVSYIGDLVIETTSVDNTTHTAHTYITTVCTDVYVSSVVEILLLYRETQVRGPPYRT